jgi:hypothetical protein
MALPKSAEITKMIGNALSLKRDAKKLSRLPNVFMT